MLIHSPLAQSLDVLLPNLTPKLVNPDAALGLKALTTHLVPILRGGFECRLRANAPQVDLQQCLVPNETELTLLQEHIATLISNGGKLPAWTRLQHFITAWLQALSQRHKPISEIWLEFDLNEASIPIPAIFIGLAHSVSSGIESYPIVTHSLDLLLQSAWYGWQDNLYRCFAACPDGVFVSHIGVMLSRNAPALRVNVKRLPADSLSLYLQQIGWQGESHEVAVLMKTLSAFVDRITLCLDVGEQVYPKIGLECIFMKQPPHESRWAVFLDYLIEQGLCDVEKREALLNWPGQTHPMNTPAAWPDELIVTSLLGPIEHFSLFERRLSHIKVVWASEKQLEAKAYLWFEHHNYNR